MTHNLSYRAKQSPSLLQASHHVFLDDSELIKQSATSLCLLAAMILEQGTPSDGGPPGL